MRKTSNQRPASRTTADPCVAGPTVNLNESPLAWLARRKDKDGRPMLEDYELAAGERLRADFWFGHMTPRVTSNWSQFSGQAGGQRAAPDHGASMSDAALAARQRARHALSAAGPEFADILIDVCCHWKGLEQVEKALGWPPRCGKVILKKALRQLARHYGMIAADGRTHASRARPSHWGTDDYRPRADFEPDFEPNIEPGTAPDPRPSGDEPAD